MKNNWEIKKLYAKLGLYKPTEHELINGNDLNVTVNYENFNLENYYYFPKYLKNDPEITLKAEKTYKLFGESLINNYEFNLRLIKQNDKYFEFLSPQFRNDKKIASIAIKKTSRNIIYTSRNKKLIREIYKYNYKILEYVDEINDLDFWRKLLNEDLLILNFLPIKICNQLIKKL